MVCRAAAGGLSRPSSGATLGCAALATTALFTPKLQAPILEPHPKGFPVFRASGFREAGVSKTTLRMCSLRWYTDRG